MLRDLLSGFSVIICRQSMWIVEPTAIGINVYHKVTMRPIVE